jgi:DNA-binding LacI/PurR family transcriptional regulator
MEELAALAEVSQSSVSLVLNGKADGRIGKAKQEKIRNLAKFHSYRPNLNARSLITRKSHEIGVLSFNTHDRFYADVLPEIQLQLMQRGYVGINLFWGSCPEAELVFESVLTRGVAGIITFHEDLSLLPPGVPAVLCKIDDPAYDRVIFDMEGSLKESISYLISLGHRKIGYLGKTDTDPRYKAFHEMMSEFGLPVNPKWIGELTTGSLLFSSAYECAMEYLQRPDLPTAVIAKSDVGAITAITAAHKLGIRIPEDLSIIGANNIRESKYIVPPLTTHGCNTVLLAEKLAETLLVRLENPECPPIKEVIETRLIIRESCKAINGK